ncbi:MAG TPA: ribosome maturation factor RimM [Casimicrobiaceae bacterium]|nr:ribosome maturation factor RimM [Casimicrobiaceae bacterium]
MGRIAAPYGVQGWCRIQPFSQDPETLLAHSTWWLQDDDDASWRPGRLVDARMHGRALIAKLTDVDNREQALALRGRWVGVPREALPRDEGQFFWSELVGFEVVNRAGRILGSVAGFIESGAHPILRVRAGGQAVEQLIPWVAAYVERVDGEARRIEVDWEADY